MHYRTVIIVIVVFLLFPAVSHAQGSPSVASGTPTTPWEVLEMCIDILNTMGMLVYVKASMMLMILMGMLAGLRSLFMGR